MRPTWSAVATRTRLILLLLAVGLPLGHAGAAYSQDASCPDVNILKLQYKTCMPYTYEGTTYVLCNGPYSLCTIADCSPKDAASVTCQCKVVESGLSILLPPQSGPPINTPSPEIIEFFLCPISSNLPQVRAGDGASRQLSECALYRVTDRLHQILVHL
jgi:hypothetical protein